jgi:hypothetical protein
MVLSAHPPHSWTSFSHKAVFDMEIEFFHERVTKKDPELLIAYIGRMASGDAPFFPTTLSLVYDKLVENAFPNHTPSGRDPGSPTLRESTSTLTVATSSTPIVTSSSAINLASSSRLQAPAPTPTVPSTTATKLARLVCIRTGCRRITSISNLYDGLHCPQCPETGLNGKGETGRPFMRCAECKTMRDRRVDICSKSVCGGRFE